MEAHENNTSYQRPTIFVHIQPGEKILEMPRVKTVWQLLKALSIQEETALVAREGKLLTPDQHIFPNDRILVRKVASRG